ncbi:MAG: TolC family protein [Candidatus Latescibacteria bacterium]|jgi:outer membrane protein|nr:TolC family protein [Candidatus Latescibacterota bacterium]
MNRNCISKYLIFALLFFAMALSGSPAQEARVLTYEEAIDVALNRSFTVKSNMANREEMQHNYEYFMAMFKPRIDFSMFAPSWRENVAPIQRTDGLPVYNSTGLMQLGGDLKYTYMLPTGGNFALSTQLYRERLKTVLAMQDYKELGSKQAYSSLSVSFSQPILTKNTLRENLQEAEYWYERSSSQFTRGQINIIYRVTDGFYALYRATREVEIASERLANSEEAFRIAKLKGETGRIPEGDVLIAEIEASQNRASLLEQEGALERAKDAFIQLIGLEQSEDVRIVTDLKYDTFDVNMDKAIGEALKNRMEIYESELDIKLQEISIDKAKRVRELSGEITAYYDLTGVSTMGSGSTGDLFESSFDNFVDRPPNRGVTLTLSYPVFDWGRGAAQVQREEVSLKEKQLRQEDTKRTIVREVKDIVRRVEETGNRLLIQEKNQPIAQRSYEISRMRFENGDITSQELGREQERLTDSQLQYLSAFISYQLAVADLKRKTLWDFKNDQSYIVDTGYTVEDKRQKAKG